MLQRQHAALQSSGFTWFIYFHSQLVGCRQPLVRILNEDRRTTLVASRLPLARTVDEKMVTDFVRLVLYFELVALLDSSRPADGTVVVQRQDVIEVCSIPLEAPSQCYRHMGPSHPAHQRHIISYSHYVVATYKVHLHIRFCNTKRWLVRKGEVITQCK